MSAIACPPDHSVKSGTGRRSLMSLYAKSKHKRAAKALGYALTVDSEPAWLAASAIWQARLTPQETASMAWAALAATEPALAQEVASAALRGAGAPLPSFGPCMDDASWWADIATAEERACYAVACFNRFSRQEREEFRVFAGGG